MDEPTLIYLRALAKKYPDVDSALAEIAHLQAVRALPVGTIHIVSDVHGEFKKLKHILSNASGSLRPLVEATFPDLPHQERLDLLNLIYYPREAFAHLAGPLPEEERRPFVRRKIDQMTELLRHLLQRYSLRRAERAFPAAYRGLLRELIFAPHLGRSAAFLDALLAPLLLPGRDQVFLRHLAHVLRNLLIDEVIVAGDLGDRGPRLDKVLSFLARQPNVSYVWGNHDASWMGACLGHPALIATVVRIALRYRRLSQLEEGYGIPMAPLERLARTVYGDDPAARFACKGEGLREPLLMARMQKAIAVLQFKLEGRLVRDNPHFGMVDRDLLSRVDAAAGTVDIDGTAYPLLDRHLPTVDWADPLRLSPEETAAIDRLRQSFMHSPILWDHMRLLARRGGMYLQRGEALIFHGCVPVDDAGGDLPLCVDGEALSGKSLFRALNRVVTRAFRDPRAQDLDLLWYLWAGPRSPLFGKDKMATFETYFVADKATHKETKNAYFKLIHKAEFCERVLRAFGAPPTGLIVNGHVPVKVEQGESPLKDSGQAVTIDGAFSEAYGDKGYTLVLEAARIYLAQHHHFESVREAIEKGADIIPAVQELRTYERPRTVADTEQGGRLLLEIDTLLRLIQAYEDNLIQSRSASGGR